MATMDDAARLAMALPEVTEGTSYGNRSWKVGKISFVWDRPLTKADIKRLGDEPAPSGPLLGIRTEDLHEKEAILQARPDCCFTIAHFDNYPALLVRLDDCDLAALTELITDAWLAAAPERVAREFIADRRLPGILIRRWIRHPSRQRRHVVRFGDVEELVEVTR